MRAFIAAGTIALTMLSTSIHAVRIFDAIDDKLTYPVGKPLLQTLPKNLQVLKFTNSFVGIASALGYTYHAYHIIKDSSSTTFDKFGSVITPLFMFAHTYAHSKLIDSLTTGRMPLKILASLLFRTPLAPVLRKAGYLPPKLTPLFAAATILRFGINYVYVSNIEDKLIHKSPSSLTVMGLKYIHGLITLWQQFHLHTHIIKHKHDAAENPLALSFWGASVACILDPIIKSLVHKVASDNEPETRPSR